jgi:hypothetical protein
MREIRISGFRSARALAFAPGPLCALVGEANVGKSNVLTAIWRLLDPGAPLPAPQDATLDGPGVIRLEATLAAGKEIALEVEPPGPPRRIGPSVPVLFLGGEQRTGSLVTRSGDLPHVARHADELLAVALAERDTGGSAAAPAALVAAIEACCRAGIQGLVLLIEEPELYLRPQAQRYLYRLLRALTRAGNQVIYSTHAPAFLNVARLEELALVEHRPAQGTTIVQPQPLPTAEAFRAVNEIDAERGELLLARAVLLVEGRTEKLVFPFIFQRLGHDADREAISIVECGGKPNIALFAQICEAINVPYIVVHDRDARAGRKPIQAERAVNTSIASIAGPERTVVLAPDFEAVAGLRGHSHKPERAWRSFSGIEPARIPEQLVEAVNRVLAAARD